MKVNKIRQQDFLVSSQEISFAMMLGCTASIMTTRGGKIDGTPTNANPMITCIYGPPGMGKTFNAQKIGLVTESGVFGKTSPMQIVLGQPVYFTSFHAQNTTVEELGLNIPTNQEHPDIKGICKMIRAKGTNHLTREMQLKLLEEGKSPYQIIHIDEPGRNRQILSQITSGFVDCNCPGFSPHPAYTMLVFTDNGLTTEGTVEFSTHLINRCCLFSIDSNNPQFNQAVVEIKKKRGDADRAQFRWVGTQQKMPLHDVNYAFKSIRSDAYATAIDQTADYMKNLTIEINGKKAKPFAGLPYFEKVRKAAIAGTMGYEGVLQDDLYDLISEQGLKSFDDFKSCPVSGITDSILPTYLYTLAALAEIQPKHPSTKEIVDWVKKEIKANKQDLYREVTRRHPGLFN